jgi:hypothetical protein
VAFTVNETVSPRAAVDGLDVKVATSETGGSVV